MTIDPSFYFPGDPPLPETLVVLSWFFGIVNCFAAAVLCALSFKFSRLRCASDITTALGVTSVLFGLVCYMPIQSRNEELRELKVFLHAREAAVQRFALAHSGLSPKEIARRFRSTDAGPWIFQQRSWRTPVAVYPRLINDGVHMVVNFGGRAADVAVFDPETMWTIYSE